MGETHAGRQLALGCELRRIGDQGDALVVMEALLVGVHLPALGGSVGLAEHPAVTPGELDGSGGSQEELVLALEGVAQGRLPQEGLAAGELELAVRGVGLLAAVLPGQDRSTGAHARRIGVQEPVHHVELVRADLAGQAQRHLAVELPVDLLLARRIARTRTPVVLATVVRLHGDDVADGSRAREGLRQSIDRV
jgi:hypothetical protein